MYPYFVLLFCTGCFFIFLAFCFSPLFLVAPRKCANLINVGSICIMTSFGLIKGWHKFFVEELLCNKNKFVFAWAYLLSILLSMYSSMIIKSWVWTIVALIVESVCLLYFICSYFPYGTEGMKYMLAFIKTGV